MSEGPRQPRNADDLLKWSIAASANESNNDGESIQRVAGEISSGKRPDLADPALYEALMGKSEAQMMREELSAALDVQRTEKDRVQALDNFEMLIENIDNANNITSMKMWSSLIGLLEAETSSEPVKLAALWIIGTAVQNNDKAQMAILEHNPLKPILSLLQHSHDGQVRSKAVYALSGIVKHNAKAVILLAEERGFDALRGALLDPDVSLRRKTAFLVNSLLLQDDSADHPEPPLHAPSTAVAPVRDDNSLPPMPLEQPPATQRDGIRHPSIPPLLISSLLLNALIVSLLTSAGQDRLPSSVKQGIDTAASAGPDGDIELRDDLDYAEKATRACLTFAAKIGKQQFEGQSHVKILLTALLDDLRGEPVDKDEGTERWQELGLTREEIEDFHRKIESL